MANKATQGIIEWGDTPVAVGELRSWSAPSEAAEIDVTVMGTDYASFIPGTINARVECELFFGSPEDAGQALILAQLGNDVPQTLALYPFGKGSTIAYLTGKATVMSFSPQASADGAVEMSVNFAGDGAAPLVWGDQA